MFAPGQVPGDSPNGFTASSRRVPSEKRITGGRSFVGSAPGAGKRSSREALGTLAKTAVANLKRGGFRKSTFRPGGEKANGCIPHVGRKKLLVMRGRQGCENLPYNRVRCRCFVIAG